jgi:phage tail P2-like protein
MSDPSLLPPNATSFEHAIEAVHARASNQPVPIDLLWRAEICPTPLLPWLAWAFSVDAWDSGWDEATKRRVIAASIEVHRRKGTRGAVRRALGALDIVVTIVEWWERKPLQGIPHTFSLVVDALAHRDADRFLGNNLIRALRATVDAVKPARSHYDLAALAPAAATLAVGAVQSGHALVARTADLRPDSATAASLSLASAFGLRFECSAEAFAPRWVGGIGLTLAAGLTTVVRIP